MQTDQTISLRPGAGHGRAFGPRTSTSVRPTFMFDTDMDSHPAKAMSERVRYSRDELYKFKDQISSHIPERMRAAISDIEAEVSIDGPAWGRPTTNILPPVSRDSGSDSWDWRSEASPASFVPSDTMQQQGKELLRRPDVGWCGRETDVGALEVDATSIPAIVRAAKPWTARRGAIPEEEKVVRAVKGVLNKLTPEKYEILLEQLVNAGINSVKLLKEVISLVFDKAVLEPTFCPMYAQMCVHLSTALPEFPSHEGDGKPVTFRRVLLNSCQEAFEGADNMRAEICQMTKPKQEVERFEKEKLLKLRTLGNIQLIGELFKKKMIPEKVVHHCIQMLLRLEPKSPPAEENVEAVCQLFSTVGKQLDESPKSTLAMTAYFSKLKEFSRSPQLPPRIRFLTREVLDLRVNEWVPRRKVVKAKTINEIHAEAEKNLGLHPGMMGWRNGRGAQGGIGLTNGGNGLPQTVMPGMPSLTSAMLATGGPTKRNVAPNNDMDGWEVFSGSRKSKANKEFQVPVVGLPLGMPGPKSNSAVGRASLQSVENRSALADDLLVKVGELSVNRNIVEKVGLPQQAGVVPPSPADLWKKSEALLKEYLTVFDLKEATACVEELRSPEFHPQLVLLAITIGFEQERHNNMVRKLLEHLHTKKVLSSSELRAGVILVAEQLEDLSLDIPKAPGLLGEVMGNLTISEVVEVGLLEVILLKVEDPTIKRGLYDAAVKAANLWPNSRVLVEWEKSINAGTW